MATQDLRSRVTVSESLTNISRSSTANGTSVDMSGFEGAMILYTIGLVVGTAATVVLEDSDDDSAFTAVAAAKQVTNLPATISTTEDVNIYSAQYFGNRRHLRVAITAVGTTIIMGATVVQSYGRHINA